MSAPSSRVRETGPGLDLVRDLLDQGLLDRHSRAMGRVDGLVLELVPGRAPRVAFIEIGAATLARRIHPGVERALNAVFAWFHGRLPRPVRVPVRRIHRLGVDVLLDVDAEEAGVLSWETLLRERVVKALPGGAR